MTLANVELDKMRLSNYMIDIDLKIVRFIYNVSVYNVCLLTLSACACVKYIFRIEFRMDRVVSQKRSTDVSANFPDHSQAGVAVYTIPHIHIV